MKNDEPIDEKKQVVEEPKSVLEQIIQEGARKLLQLAIVVALPFYFWGCAIITWKVVLE